MRHIASIVLLCSTSHLAAQDSTQSFTRHTIFIEGAGAAGMVSLNYDYLASESIFLRLGTGYIPPHMIGSDYYQTIHGAVAGRTSNDGSTFEFGFGVSSAFGEPREFVGPTVVAILGYRYQPRSGGPVIRLSLTPFLIVRFSSGHPAGMPMLPWGGASVGYTF